jgi:Icc-related predicted phosphoesterase
LGRVLESADLIVLAGDLTMFGRRHAASEMIGAVAKHCASVLAVPGNCDYPEVEEYLVEKGMGLHGRSQIFRGVTFFGLGGSLPCLGNTPNEYTEDELARLLDTASEGVEPNSPSVLVSHQPPADTALDLANNGAHVGSASVRACIEALQPEVCFTGHIHEARGTDTIGRTTLINPGPLAAGGYAYMVLEEGVETVEIRGLA